MSPTNYVARGGTQGQDLSSQTLPSSVSTEHLTLGPFISSFHCRFLTQIGFETHNQMFILQSLLALAFSFIVHQFFVFFYFLFCLHLEDNLPKALSCSCSTGRTFRIHDLKIIDLGRFPGENESALRCSPRKHHLVLRVKASTFWLSPCNIFYKDA